VKLTKELLKKWEACSDGVAWFENFGETKSAEVMEGLLKDKRLEWANWLIARLLNRKGKIRYAIFAAEEVLELFEKKYPEDKRPRKAIKAAKAVLRKNNKETRDAAGAAAWAAGDAARAAVAAARAAVAAEAAVWASEAAAWVSGDAARAARAAEVAGAAGDAAGDAMKEKIIRYGLGLHLKGGL